MINGDGFDKPEYTQVQHSFVGKSPDKKRVYRWKKSLTKRQIELFEFYSKDFL